jgi:hypothetical protein
MNSTYDFDYIVIGSGFGGSVSALRLRYKPRWWRFGGKSINSEIPKGFERSPNYIPIANETAKRLAEK